MTLAIKGYNCIEKPLAYPAASWPTGIFYSIGEGIQAICTAGHKESTLGPPNAICSARGNNSSSPIWANYSGACEGMSGKF